MQIVARGGSRNDGILVFIVCMTITVNETKEEGVSN